MAKFPKVLKSLTKSRARRRDKNGAGPTSADTGGNGARAAGAGAGGHRGGAARHIEDKREGDKDSDGEGLGPPVAGREPRASAVHSQISD